MMLKNINPLAYDILNDLKMLLEKSNENLTVAEHEYFNAKINEYEMFDKTISAVFEKLGLGELP